MEPSSQGDTVEKKKSIFANPIVQSISGVLGVVLVLVAVLFFRASSSVVKIENSQIAAPIISISPTVPGTLTEVYVRTGQIVAPNTPLAKVGSEILTSEVSGIVTAIENNPGAVFNPGQAVISMINPDELRVVGTIDENKGLSKISVGQPATFTVDAFGSQQFTGIVDEIAPSANQSAIAFSISDKRETKTFDVSIRFDVAAYPEFKNGMSARSTIYTR